MNKRVLILAGLLALSSLLATACSAVSASVTKPNVVITSPPSNSQFHDGDQIAVQSTSSDLAGVSRVELMVDGVVVRTDPSPQPQVTFTVIQAWAATTGVHTLAVRAINASNGVSDPAAVSVLVLANVPTATPTSSSSAKATATPAPRACLNSAFVTDVTVPDGTALTGGQVFNKIWRVRNSGACAWSTGDELVFASGESMTSSTVIAVPNTAPGATADLLVSMTAPATPGPHTGTWRLRSAGGAFFGTLLNVTINVIGTPPTACALTPVIASFSASSTTITPGQSATLNWGFVSNAERADIDNGIGGVATPGSATVSPGSTTTYTLTAACGSKVVTAQVTINVVSPTAAPTATPTQPPPTPTP